MKINILVPTRSGGKFADSASTHSSITGEQVSGPSSPEEDLIDEIDELKMSPEKIVARRFLKFLGNRRLTMDTLKLLSHEDQVKIKEEFINS